MKEYIEVNRKLWNDRVSIHVDSEFYDQKGFLAGKSSLKNIELALLGDVQGKDVIHLQCHYGQDSLSLARMGARVTGIDFSDKAIEVAVGLNQSLDLGAEFYCCDVYDTLQVVSKKFDIVFTTYGVIGWLPHMNKWAKVIADLLKPGGRLIFVEFHPVVWMMDEQFDFIKYSYFNTEEIRETEEGSYADRYKNIKNESISWNHPFSDVVQSLLDAGLSIRKFQEFDYSPYACFDKMIKMEEDKYQIKGLEGKLPMIYAIEAFKPM